MARRNNTRAVDALNRSRMTYDKRADRWTRKARPVKLDGTVTP